MSGCSALHPGPCIAQASLFPDIELSPTIAMQRGESKVYQCGHCGTLLCVPSGTRKPHGQCPSCLLDRGWRLQPCTERCAIGPFQRVPT